MIQEDDTANSYRETREFYCQNCEETYENEIWLIIDVQEHPGLLKKIQDDWLPVGECPDCGEKDFSAPLLLYLRGDVPPTLLATQKKEQVFLTDKLEVITLMEHLQETTQDETIKDHFYEPGNWVEKVNLSEKLQDYLEVTLQDQRKEGEQALQKFAEEMPEEYLEMVFTTYFGTSDWNQRARVVEKAPMLLTEQVDSFLQKMIDGFKAQGMEDEAQAVVSNLEILIRAREIGFLEAVREFHQSDEN